MTLQQMKQKLNELRNYTYVTGLQSDIAYNYLIELDKLEIRLNKSMHYKGNLVCGTYAYRKERLYNFMEKVEEWMSKQPFFQSM